MVKEVSDRRYTIGVLRVDGKNYPFTTVVKGLVPELPYAIGYKREDGGKDLLISEEVPEEYRPFILAHEIRHEESFPELPEEEKCKAAMKKELEDIQKELPEKYDDYVSQRTAFFDSLVLFYENNPQQLAARPPGFLQGVQSAQDFLHSVSK